jgi:RsiW-degrading membrane proteinase PrsW (M82 family)
VPSLIYLVWIRNTERYGREPYGRLLRIFILGATLSIVGAVVLEMILMILLSMNVERVYEILGENQSLESLILAVVIAPLVEELTKGMSVLRYRRLISDIEDGIIFGAAAGLGFAATENLLYESTAYFTDGAEAFIATAVVRSLCSALLHASASSVFGLGIARSTKQRKSMFPYYVGAVVMHGLFNYFASFGALYEEDMGPQSYLIGLVAAFVIAIGGILVVRAKIRELDTSTRANYRS